ncbi:MAG: antitoxin (DNA-binding transcriptional repressor) of toxin-antitoxin stability system [Myxococcota bacterium]|jgi:antitoxin (DNA-binding transcriptional repressor) of toxin-antitoxin stability system
MASTAPVRQIATDELPPSLNALLSQAEAGVVIELVRDGKVVARIQPSAPPPRRRRHLFSPTRGGL